MIESDLRFLIRELLNESELYRDNAGYQFKIIRGKLYVVKGPKGPFNPPRLIPDNKLKDAIQKITPNDDKLQSLLNKDGGSGSGSLLPSLPKLPSWLGGEDKETKNIIHPELAKMFPNFRLSILDSSKNPAIGTTSIKECSQWAGQFVGVQGNAWHATAIGSVKFNIFDELDRYKEKAESLLKSINKTKDAQSSNAQTDHLLKSILPAPTTVSSQMNYGDVVGLYHADSKHAAEALFGSALLFSIPKNAVQMPGPFVTASAKVNTLSGWVARPWLESDFGKDRDFTIVKPLSFNTHLGFVGALYRGRPVVFHNVTGTIKAFLAERPDNSDRPVWVKSPDDFQAGIPVKV